VRGADVGVQERVTAHILARASWTYSRASGPGGQRRDHAETRAELTVRASDLEGLRADLVDAVTRGLRLEERPLRLRSGTERSREMNREIVERRLRARVGAVLEPPPPSRRATRPTRASRERRLAEKARRAGTKAGRRSVAPGDD
jgi:ribosome-associated protein